MINCAVDASLARSIFVTISSTKGPEATAPEILHLDFAGAFEFGGGRSFVARSDFMVYYRYLTAGMPASVWVTRNIRDDCRNDLNVSLMAKGYKSYTPRSRFQVDTPCMPSREEMFTSSWPNGGHGMGEVARYKGLWINHWHSFPLELA